MRQWDRGEPRRGESASAEGFCVPGCAGGKGQGSAQPGGAAIVEDGDGARDSAAGGRRFGAGLVEESRADF